MYIITLRLKTEIVEPEETATARQWLSKHISTAMNTCNSASGVSYAVCAEVV
jgi:hypothetical protein